MDFGVVKEEFPICVMFLGGATFCGLDFDRGFNKVAHVSEANRASDSFMAHCASSSKLHKQLFSHLYFLLLHNHNHGCRRIGKHQLGARKSCQSASKTGKNDVAKLSPPTTLRRHATLTLTSTIVRKPQCIGRYERDPPTQQATGGVRKDPQLRPLRQRALDEPWQQYEASHAI